MWLSYTYLYVRMCRNPLVYGIPWDQKEADPHLYTWRTELARLPHMPYNRAASLLLLLAASSH